MYEYKAKVVNVVDGDTLDLFVELGLEVSVSLRARLLGVNAPEKRGETKEAGIKARDFVSSMVLNKEVVVQTFKDRKEKYGRYLVIVLYKDETGEEKDLSRALIQAGLAVAYLPGKK